MLRSHHLAGRLFTLLFAVMVGGFAFFTYLSSVRQNDTLLQEIALGGRRSADLIARSADFAMLENKRDVLTRMMRDVGGEPGIEVARIYNKRGTIALSSDSTEHGRTLDMEAEACNVCHTTSGAVKELPDAGRSRVIERANGRTLGVIHPIYNRPECSGPPCHAHSLEQSVLGLLEVRMNLAGVDEILAENVWEGVTMAAILTLLVAGLAGLFVHYVVHRPVISLTEGTREITAGNLNVRLPVRGGIELEQLASDFNRMAARLATAKSENEQWAKTLEQRVAQKTIELEALHQRIMHVDRMASLGRLATTVAHELNNPLSGVLVYAKLLQRRATRAGQEVPEELNIIANETQRCGEIVKDLLGFARRDIGESKLHSVEQLVKQAVSMVRHHLELSRIQIHLEIEHVEMECDGAQIEQALIALFVNAIEAMPEGGDLTVKVRSFESGRTIQLQVIDNGVGMDQEDSAHIFEPFYTTKKDGKGVGLGLAVVYGIITRHGGQIEVESQRGSGTMFSIDFPAMRGDPKREASNV